ncbi:ABC-2 family transporter protein [Streptomyces sp. YIM 130001]|uniref:ABC transporter permease n=1 Tax=Streptomyces sp. YIM 130001 TaxID=2259644 RepID=UPI000E64D946|nr:ABC transporter permease [Streptomyces sp. YIM 130001]RII13538.1 ABC-2 family transporter protein [Streptomyces sp. YIM 130001]
MTTTTQAALPASRSTHRVTTARVLRSEWHKLRTLRSTWITVGSACATVLAIGILMGATYETGGGDGDVDTVVLTLIGSQFAQFFLAVLAVLMIAGEYATGMIRASLSAVPRRLPVLWAKAGVFAAVSFAAMSATALLTFGLTQPLFFQDTDQAAAFSDPGVARALFGTAAALTLLGLLALGLGGVLRSVPGAIGAFICGVLVLPEVLAMLPYDAVETASRYFPPKAAEALSSAEHLPDAASPGAALLALTLWAAASLTAAALLLRHRDV